MIGFKHLTFKWIHLLFAGVLILLLPTRLAFKSLLFFTFGQALALILVDVGLPGFDLLFVDILGTILIVLICYAAVREKRVNPYLPLIFLFGLLHGLSYSQELSRLDLTLEQKLPALFMFNITIDVGHYVLAGILFFFVKIFRKTTHRTWCSASSSDFLPISTPTSKAITPS